jgi:hypothetical protein
LKEQPNPQYFLQIIALYKFVKILQEQISKIPDF